MPNLPIELKPSFFCDPDGQVAILGGDFKSVFFQDTLYMRIQGDSRDLTKTVLFFLSLFIMHPLNIYSTHSVGHTCTFWYQSSKKSNGGSLSFQLWRRYSNLNINSEPKNELFFKYLSPENLLNWVVTQVKIRLLWKVIFICIFWVLNHFWETFFGFMVFKMTVLISRLMSFDDLKNNES